jgi:membrane protease YdiL (CAAX protease family)
MVAVVFGITAIADGRQGVRQLRGRLFRFLVSPIWYVAALLVLPASALGVAVAFEGSSVVTAIGEEPAVAVSWLAELAVPLVLINFWEEIAWSGFVLDRLQRRLGPVRATVATTWAQAAFHIPLIFIVGGVSDIRLTPDQYPFYFAALFIFPIGNRMVGTWLYNRSGRSVPIVALTHSSWNFASGTAFLPVLVTGFSSLWAYAGFAVLAVILLVATRGRLGFEASVQDDRGRVRGLRTAEALAR